MKALGWIVAGLLAVALFWNWTVSIGAVSHSEDRRRALVRENDSLRIATRAREARVDRLTFVLDSTKKELDSAWANVPPEETLYIGHRATAASLSYRRKWRDMGVLPRDTTR